MGVNIFGFCLSVSKVSQFLCPTAEQCPAHWQSAAGAPPSPRSISAGTQCACVSSLRHGPGCRARDEQSVRVFAVYL